MDGLQEAISRHGKTPIMWLQEICVKQGCMHPKYEERDLRKSVSDPPKFEVTAIVSNFKGPGTTESASGRSTTKKAAKQESALALLHKLGINATDLSEVKNSKNTSASSAPKIETHVVLTAATKENNDIVVDSTDNLSKLMQNVEISPTSCAELMELCAKRGLQNPEYNELKEDGPAHCKTFYIECRVRGLVGGKPDLVVVQCSNQKKKAKNLAAATMIRTLRSEVHQDETILQLLERAERDQTGLSKLICSNITKCQDLIAHEHHHFHHFLGPTVLELHEKDVFPDQNHLEMLETIAREEQFKINFAESDWVNDVGMPQSYCELLYSKSIQGPSSVFVGQGDTVSQARSNCAREALSFLKIVTRP